MPVKLYYEEVRPTVCYVQVQLEALQQQQKEVAACLAHYATKVPNDFVQFDGYDTSAVYYGTYAECTNDVVDGCIYDLGGGTLITSRLVTELMGGSTVRVLMNPAEEPQIVADLLHRIADLIAKSDAVATYSQCYKGEQFDPALCDRVEIIG